MARGSTTPRIRTAREGDLRALYELAGQALLLDSFSPELLAEKLFTCAAEVAGKLGVR